jgi:hypothetical protein
MPSCFSPSEPWSSPRLHCIWIYAFYVGLRRNIVPDSTPACHECQRSTRIDGLDIGSHRWDRSAKQYCSVSVSVPVYRHPALIAPAARCLPDRMLEKYPLGLCPTYHAFPCRTFAPVSDLRHSFGAGLNFSVIAVLHARQANASLGPEVPAR